MFPFSRRVGLGVVVDDDDDGDGDVRIAPRLTHTDREIQSAPHSEHSNPSDASSVASDQDLRSDGPHPDNALLDAWASDILRDDAGGTASRAVGEAAAALRDRLVRRSGVESGTHGGNGGRVRANGDGNGDAAKWNGDAATIEPTHARIGGALHEAAAFAAAAKGATDDGVEDEDAVRRMELACRAILLFCGDILTCAPGHDPPTPMPPLGTHLIRCCPLSVQRDQSAADAAEVPLAVSPPTLMSLYVQDQCSYVYDDAARTVDHFLDGARQRVHASMKVTAAPAASLRGRALLVDLLQPPPHPRRAMIEDTGGDDGAAAAKDDVREGCFVELWGASGHPDYLRRVRGVKLDDQEGVIKGEVYAFNLPSVRIDDFFKGPPKARLIGRVQVRCKTTGVAANIDFRPHNTAVAASLSTAATVVSGCVKQTDRGGRSHVVRLLLGTLEDGIHSAAVRREGRRTEIAVSGEEAKDEGEGSGITRRGDDSEVKAATESTTGHDLTRVVAATFGSQILPGAVTVADALVHPGCMTLRRLWHTIVDATHAADLGEPANSVKARRLQILRPPAAALQRPGGDSLRNVKVERVGAVDAAAGGVDCGPSGGELDSGERDTVVGKMMRYELALVLADRLPLDAPPPLPRYWSPMKAPSRDSS